MPLRRFGVILLGSLVAVLGCFSPVTTRMPTFQAGDPRVEKQRFDLHDPLPDAVAGPDTQSRPRGFVDQRSEPRRTLEGRMLLGLPPGLESTEPRIPSNQWKYPDSVRE